MYLTGELRFEANHIANLSSVDPAERELWRRAGKEATEFKTLTQKGLTAPERSTTEWMIESTTSLSASAATSP